MLNILPIIVLLGAERIVKVIFSMLKMYVTYKLFSMIQVFHPHKKAL